MYLHLLAFTYAVADRKAVEAWLSQASLDSVLLSTKRYNDEILVVLANDEAAPRDFIKLHQQPAISFCGEKHCAIYRIRTTTAPELTFRSFPLREGEEWYRGTGHTTYLGMAAHRFSDEQLSWLATSTTIAAWDYLFDLVPIPAGR